MINKPRLLNLVLMFMIIFTAVGIMPQNVKAEGIIRISQVYGGGGNSGSYWTNDFIELFNAGDTTVDISGWSVQYASSTGTTWQVTSLSGTIPPGGYFLVQEAQGSGGTTPLPPPDATGTIAMSATNGKVALVDSTTALSGACPVGTVDLVGFGSANCFEGSAATPALTNTTSAIRNSGGCDDTNDNLADFTVGEPAPRNSASPTNVCGLPPAPTLKINEFSASTTGTDVEYVEIFGDPETDYFTYKVLEIEGDGTGAGIIDEVISLGTTDASGFFVVNLAPDTLENGTVSLLLVNDFTGVLGEDIDSDNDGVIDYEPWSEITDSVAISDGGGDDITYGTTTLAPNYDGLSTFAPGGASRIPDGYDTESPSDWVRNEFDLDGSPMPGEAYNTPGLPNAAQTCGGFYTPIYEIQGSGTSTPLFGTDVITEGIVVGDFQQGTYVSGTKNGFYIQDLTGDGNPLTSDGIFVYYSGSDVQVGDYVRVSGEATEYYDLTQIGSVDWILTCATGQTLPEPTVLTLPVASESDFEAYEGMYVTFPQDLVISEYFDYDRYGEIVLTSQRHLTPTALVEPGPDAVDAANAYLLDRITLDDALSVQNPDPAIHPNGLEFSIYNRFRGGDLVVNLTGILDYNYDLYRLQPTQGADYVPINPRTPAPEIIEGDIKVASLNVYNYFTTIDTGADICGPVLFTDVIGKLGEDPGTYWGTDPVTTAEHTLVRKADVCSGDTDWGDDFDPSVEWDSFAQNYIADLGTHTTTCTFDDLIISEYLEGSSNNKALEIYNGTGAPVDMGDYEVVLYTNGSQQPGNRQGWAEGTMLADGDTYVIANASAAEGILDVADITSTVTYFNGDDVVSLQKAGTGGMECRGADDAEELYRQRTKIIEALAAIDADVIGLMEIENDRPGPAPDYAAADLVQGLNDLFGAGTYNYIATGPIGTDAIKVALLYKPGNVTPVGDFAILDSTIDPRFLDDFNRPTLAQTFEQNLLGEKVTVAVNHLKSKGSDCNAIGDPDLGDGAGNCNLTRLAAAQAEVDWLASDPTGTGAENILIIGDLNSYDKEDPIDAIKAGPDDVPGTGDDYYDMIYEVLGEDAYGYVFDGQIGYLDYALVNSNLLPYVTDVDFWHSNADEPDIVDYDTTFKAPAQDALWEPNAYRASDHDPVVISMTFNRGPVAVDDYYETDQDVTLTVPADGVLTNDYDLNINDEITLEVLEWPMHGALTLNQDGSFEYIPDPGYFGKDSFIYNLISIPPETGRAEYSDTATVYLTVNPAYEYYFPIIYR